MRKIRKGNDIIIRWTVSRGDTPEVFPQDTEVMLQADNNTNAAITYTIDGNVITANFYGKDQIRLGSYRLLLVERGGEVGMATLDHTPAFVLVERSALAGGEDDTITTEVVDLTDTLEVAQGGGGTTDYNELENKPKINSVELVGNKTSAELGILTEQRLEEGLATKQNVISDLATIRSNAQRGSEAKTAIDGYGDIVTHNVSEFATSAQGAKAETAVQPSALNSYATKTELQDVEDAIPSVIDNVTSTAADDALSAKQGKLLNDRINNLATRGRFLSLWNCSTGLPLTNPSGTPYQYQTGDFFIVSSVGATNYVPDGSSYTGQPSTTVYSGAIKVNDTIFFDGQSWMVLDTPAGASDIQDVYQNGSSVVSGGIAYVVVPTKTSDLTNDSGYQTDAQVQQSIGAYHDDSKVDKVSGKQLSTEDYTSEDKSNVAANTLARHTHTNKDVLDGITSSKVSSWDGKLTNQDFTISNLPANTTSFTFSSNQRCYQKVSIAASATLSFAIENMADNYVRIYNSGSSEITLAIGNVTHNSTAVAAKVGPAEIKCGVGKYVEISVIYDGRDATFTASDNLQILS